MRSSALSLRLAGAAFLLLASAAPAAAGAGNANADAAATEAGGGSATPTAATEAKPAREERKICRFDSATGSNVRGKKICLTAKQWRARQD